MDFCLNLNLSYSRLARQVLNLESSVAGITSKMELIMEKLGLQEKAKGSEIKLAVTNQDVSTVCENSS